MCTMIAEIAKIEGSGKGARGWIPIDRANVTYDHPFQLAVEHSLNIDFVNEELGLDARVPVELSAESARDLIEAIQSALDAGEYLHK